MTAARQHGGTSGSLPLGKPSGTYPRRHARKHVRLFARPPAKLAGPPQARAAADPLPLTVGGSASSMSHSVIGPPYAQSTPSARYGVSLSTSRVVRVGFIMDVLDAVNLAAADPPLSPVGSLCLLDWHPVLRGRPFTQRIGTRCSRVWSFAPLGEYCVREHASHLFPGGIVLVGVVADCPRGTRFLGGVIPFPSVALYRGGQDGEPVIGTGPAGQGVRPGGPPEG